jgi:glutamate-1-semialdehyde 2,1-aminomutase
MMDESAKIYQEAVKIFVGGVNSPVRALTKPYPLFIERGKGPYLYTIDGDKLVDYVLGYGPLILGHRYDAVYEAVLDQLDKGWLYGSPAKVALELGRLIAKHYRIDRIRFVNSGSEAVMTAIRLARGYTGRNVIVKFDGCYHGASDSVLVKPGASYFDPGTASSLGVPEEIAKLTYVLPYNDIDSLNKLMEKLGDHVAAIIVEPILANAGLIIPKYEFIEEIRYLTRQYGALLIFDEVVTGYRISISGASGYFGIEPDIITLGKIIGGGFPIGAVIGKADIMDMLTPKGKVFNAGTFNAHPISMAAGLAMIKELEDNRHYRSSFKAAHEVSTHLMQRLDELGIRYTVNRIANMYQVFIGVDKVENAEEARKADKDKYVSLHEELVKNGVYIPPSNMETCFTSSVHDDEAITISIEAIDRALSRLGSSLG